MATEYFQIPSSQGLLPLDASTSSFASSVLSSSGAIASPFPSALASSSNADPWLNANMRNLSLDDWAPSLKKSNNTPPSLFEADDIEARSWNNIVPQQTPEVLKASFELRNSYEVKNPQKVPTRQFISTSSKMDPWSVIDPSVTISSPAVRNLKKSSVNELRASGGLRDSADIRQSGDLRSSQMSMGDDEEGGSNRYKTELCKSFTETGVCRYGVKCQFAHGKEELRSVLRHPKYKTEICKTFHNTGTCPYGLRCRFIHTRTKEEHHVFASSTSSFVDSEFDEEGENEDILRMSAPPGFSVPHWSKSWTPNASPMMKKSNLKKSVA